ncbi:hypothetical protein BDC45DRAFT_597145 [Circinella umbellata]|nr:hypothetical protein BDC45DRAFT_597145 [Circinella umbellata]
MKEYAVKCNFEHPCHSFIMDPSDQTWNDLFTEGELNEIMTENAPTVLPLPAPLQHYMDKFSDATTLDQLREIALANPFHSLDNPRLHWMEGSILKVFDLLYYDIVHKYKSEANLMKRIWCFIDCAFDVGDVNYASKSSAARINSSRTSSGVEALERKRTGAKLDFLFTDAINEMGTAEADKSTDMDTTKAAVEYGMKTPKVMKDMMYEMVTKNKSSLGFLHLLYSDKALYRVMQYSTHLLCVLTFVCCHRFIFLFLDFHDNTT